MNNKKNISLVGLIISILLFVVGVGVTFAAYTYTRQGTSNSKQIVGDIYMHYNETNTLTLENAMPRNSYIANQYFEFTIDGKNTTTNKDIYFDILLSHGDLPQGKTESNRIDDKFLKFRLVEVINNNEGEDLLRLNGYNNLNNKSIYVNIIPKNTTTEVVHTYRLYMWISNDVIIGNTDSADYSESEWSNLFASIKVNVNGDFEEKIITYNDSCFYKELHVFDPIVKKPLKSEAVNACVQWTIDENFEWDEGETAEAFCSGNGTNWGDTLEDFLGWMDFEELLYIANNYSFDIVNIGLEITGYDEKCGGDVVIPNSLKYNYYTSIPTLNSNLTEDELNACVQFTIDEEWEFNEGETSEAFCNGTGTYLGQTFQELLSNEYGLSGYVKDYFYNHNIIDATVVSNYYPVKSIGNNAFKKKKFESFSEITNVYIPYGVEKIGQFAFYLSKLTNVVIPDSVKTIEKSAFSLMPGEACFEDANKISNLRMSKNIVSIGNEAFACNDITNVELPNSLNAIDAYAFFRNRLSSVTIPNNLTTIANNVFSDNQITSVVIPTSVTTIESGAFAHNQLTSVEIPNSVTTIGRNAFYGNQLTGINMPNSVTTIGESAFYGNQLTSVTIGNGITSIGLSAFSKTGGNPNLSSITVNKSCNDIKNNLLSNSTNYYPWLFQRSPYTASGVTIYGSNNEVCDTF